MPHHSVLIDVTRLAARLLEGKRPTGVDRVSLAYIAHFRPRARALVRHWGRWMALSPAASQRVFGALLGEERNPQFTLRSQVAQALVLRWGLPSGAILFNTGHSGLDHPLYALKMQRHGLRPVYFLHDLIPLTHPEYCRAGEVQRHRQRLLTMLHTGCGIIVNSEDTARALLAFAQENGLACPPVLTAHLGLNPLPVAADGAPIDSPYFVCVSTIEARKNHLLLLHVWRDLVTRLGAACPKLVLIGQRGWECEQVVDLLERCTPLRHVVIELPDCTDAQLARWLQHARALLMPSFAEGFGLPVIEALAARVPVIASDLPALREVAGDLPHYLDPIDGIGWLEAVRAFASPEHPLLQRQIQRLDSFSPPTWSAHFDRVEAWLSGLRMTGVAEGAGLSA
ncbi:glycosyltransferase family 1 protein [Thiomonas sp.]|uniref:glycosyltransferase family 4 protein n=1 Tax=Thiomonas sp. TaxID=2047785 RepID=UPI002633B570|nr:glycosyltransferase family 1 protein [Thiomonas sp.]